MYTKKLFYQNYSSYIWRKRCFGYLSMSYKVSESKVGKMFAKGHVQGAGIQASGIPLLEVNIWLWTITVPSILSPTQQCGRSLWGMFLSYISRSITYIRYQENLVVELFLPECTRWMAVMVKIRLTTQSQAIRFIAPHHTTPRIHCMILDNVRRIVVT